MGSDATWPNKPSLATHDCKVSQAVTTQSDRDRQITHDVLRIVRRLTAPPRREPLPQSLIQTHNPAMSPQGTTHPPAADAPGLRRGRGR
jgi:hypothetical protein